MNKVLIINHWGGIAGGNVSLMQIANAIKTMDNKYDLKVLCPDSPPDMIEWLNENNVDTISCKRNIAIFNHYSGSDNFILSIRSILNIIEVFKKKGYLEVIDATKNYDPDLVVINSMTLLWLGPIIRNLGYEVACFHRETYARGLFGIRTKIMKTVLAKYFHLAFISKNDMYETGKTKFIKDIITDKVDVNVYHKIKESNIRKNHNNTLEILYLGGMSRLKGAKVIVKALILLKQYNVKLVFLKYNPDQNNNITNKFNIRKLIKLMKIDYESSVIKIINRNKLWKNIEFHDTVKNPENFIINADMIVFPSTKPHQSRPLYEAGIAEVPFVISDFKQTREFTINKYNCLTFKPNNYKDLARTIIGLIEDEELKNEIVKNNYEQSFKKHNLTSLSKEIDSFFSKILNRGDR